MAPNGISGETSLKQKKIYCGLRNSTNIIGLSHFLLLIVVGSTRDISHIILYDTDQLHLA